MRRVLILLCTLAIGLAPLAARAQWVNGASAWQQQGVVSSGGAATCTGCAANDVSKWDGSGFVKSLLSDSGTALTYTGTAGVSAPSFRVTGATVPTNGLFLSAANAVGIATAGTERWIFNASGNIEPLVADTYRLGSVNRLKEVNSTLYSVNGVALAASDLSNGVTGTGAVVLANGSTINNLTVTGTCTGCGSSTGTATSITDNSATVFAKVTMSSGSTWMGDVIFKIEGKDATDFTNLSGKVTFAAIDKAGTITCRVGTPVTTASLGTAAATTSLTAFTCADAGADVLNLLVNATTSLTDSEGWPKLIHRPLSTDAATYTPQ